jgi:hypothetical protein
LIVEPELVLDPEILPEPATAVQLNELEELAVSEIFVLSPLHMVLVVEVVTTGIGLTVTVMEVGFPTQPDAIGVTTYVTVAAAELLVLVST